MAAVAAALLNMAPPMNSSEYRMPPPSCIRIVIAYDQPIFRDALKGLLNGEPGFLVIGEAAYAKQAVELARARQPDVLLLDFAIPTRGLDALRALKTASSAVRTIVFAAEAQKEAQMAAMQLGARGIVLKESPTAFLLKGIRAVMSDDYWLHNEGTSDFGEAASRVSVRPTNAAKERFRLTRREMEIVWLVASGDSNKGIARRLSVTEDTVKHHISHVFDKLGVFSRLELALFAINHGLVENGSMPS